MENRKTYHLELTSVELEQIIVALEEDANMRETEDFRSLIDELIRIKNGKSTG